MTDKKEEKKIESQPLSLSTLKAAGGVPGLAPPVKRVVTWEKSDDEHFYFDVYIRKKAYRDMHELYEGDRKYTNPYVISKLVCDEKGEQVFTEEKAYSLHEDLIQLLLAEIALVNGYGKKKQGRTKK